MDSGARPRQYVVLLVAVASAVAGFYGALKPVPHNSSNYNYEALYWTIALLVLARVRLGAWPLRPGPRMSHPKTGATPRGPGPVTPNLTRRPTRSPGLPGAAAVVGAEQDAAGQRRVGQPPVAQVERQRAHTADAGDLPERASGVRGELDATRRCDQQPALVVGGVGDDRGLAGGGHAP